MSDAPGGRNGIGIPSAMENRIIGTRSRGFHEGPGLGLLQGELSFVLQATIDRRGTALCQQLGRTLTAIAEGVVPVGLYRGNIFFLSMTDVPASLCNEANSSMEARALAKAGQVLGLGPV